MARKSKRQGLRAKKAVGGREKKPDLLTRVVLSFIFFTILVILSTNRLVEMSRVVKVIDGDTIVLANGEEVRYIGIDTPEISVPVTALECYGSEATTKNRELVEGQEVKLVRDFKDRDRYGRLLRYVYLTDSKLFVNLELAQAGYARLLTVYPNVSHAKEVQSAVEKAQKEGRGMWSASNCHYPH